MDQTKVEVFPIDSWGQRIVLILNVFLFGLFASAGASILFRSATDHSTLVSPLRYIFAVMTMITGVILTILGVYTLKAKWNARIEIDDETFRFYKTKSDLEYEKDLEFVFSLQSAKTVPAFKPNVFLIHFCDGRRFTFASQTARSKELRTLLEEKTQKTFDPQSKGPTAEESLPFRMSDSEIMTLAEDFSDWWGNVNGIPANLEEARERFGNSLVGHWSENNFTRPPIESSLTVLADGYAILTWSRIFGDSTHELYQWRQLAPFKIEVREISAAGSPGEWRKAEYSIEEFRMDDRSKPSYELKGIFGGLTFSSTIAPDLTFEKYKVDYPLNFDTDDED